LFNAEPAGDGFRFGMVGGPNAVYCRLGVKRVFLWLSKIFTVHAPDVRIYHRLPIIFIVLSIGNPLESNLLAMDVRC